MAIRLTCDACHSTLQAPEHFAGRKARCPGCGAELVVPTPQPEPEEIIDAVVVEEPPVKPPNPWDIQFLDDLHEPIEVAEFLEPPVAPRQAARAAGGAAAATAERPDPGEWMKRMFEAMLDPRSIQWLLILGGGLMVLGLLIWLISTGIFNQPLPLAILFGAGSVGLLGGGWFVALKTRYKIAGRALAFLGCVVLPLNLWFYHAQNLLVLDDGLWVGGLACVLMYIATVWVMRDALFMYAVEVGITLTAVLLLGNFDVAGKATYLSILLMGLALTSIHGYLAFPADADLFDRRRFGLPLFWCGHAQLATSLIILLGTQLAGWLDPVGNLFDLPEAGVLLTNSTVASGLLWLAGAYAYLYSDLFVRRIGVYTYLAAVALVMAEVTLIGFDALGAEGLIAALAVTACVVSLLTKVVPSTESHLARAVAPLALLLSIVPVLMGIVLHARANSVIAEELHLTYETTWTFVIVMLVVAVANRISAYVYQGVSDSLSAVYFFFSAAALIIAAAGWLRILNVGWLPQTLWLMLIPIGYLIAARLWRGKKPERPLGWVAHAGTAVIFAHALLGTVQQALNGSLEGRTHLLLGILLAETSVFYALAAVFRRKRANIYFAVAAGCGAAWQLLLFAQLPEPLFAIIFAALGLAMIFAARGLGLSAATVYNAAGEEQNVTRGRGAELLWAGHGILSMAILVAILSGLAKVVAVGLEERALELVDWVSLGLITLMSAAAAIASPAGPWRRVYWVATIALACLAFLTINVAIDLTMLRKVEVFLVCVGLVMLVAGYIGRFREADSERANDTVTLGLWLGSLLAAMPLVVTVFYHWATKWEFAYVYDEFALITITLLMLATGVVWQVKASTLIGGGTFSIYMVALVVSLMFVQKVYVGIYLAGGGGLIFLAGLLLAMYRDRLVELPDRIAKREGVFRVISWR